MSRSKGSTVKANRLVRLRTHPASVTAHARRALGALFVAAIVIGWRGTASAQAPSVTTQPASQSVCVGASASFTAAASGTPAPTVQWLVSTNGGSTFSNVSGATSTTLSFPASGSQNGYQYRAMFTNGAGSATSNPATLTVNSLAITIQPSNQTVNAGQSVSFTAATSGSPAPTVQWQVSTNGGSSFTDISGAMSGTLTFTAAGPQNGNQYRAVFTNLCGNPATDAATLTVNTAPAVTTQPANRVVEVAPERLLKVEPPLVLTCHWTVGAGVPLAAAVKLALAPTPSPPPLPEAPPSNGKSAPTADRPSPTSPAL